MSSFQPPPPPPPGNPPQFSMLAMLAGLLPKHYLHISFYYPDSLPELEASHHIQPIINTADDWLKYTNNCFIVWTRESPNQWYDKFAAVEQLKHVWILIFKVDLSPVNRYGRLPQWVWDWIQKVRTT